MAFLKLGYCFYLLCVFFALFYPVLLLEPTKVPTLIRKFQTIPALAVTLNAQALESLKQDSNILCISENTPRTPTLNFI